MAMSTKNTAVLTGRPLEQAERLEQARAALAEAEREQREAAAAARLEKAIVARKARPAKLAELEAKRRALQAEEQALREEWRNRLEARQARNGSARMVVDAQINGLHEVTADVLLAAGDGLKTRHEELQRRQEGLQRRINGMGDPVLREPLEVEATALGKELAKVKHEILFGG